MPYWGKVMKYTQQRGFSLIEIMVVVLIIAVLAAFAWPAWQNYVTRSNRTAAQSCLMEQAQFMERFYTQNMSYETSRGGSSVSLPSNGCVSELSDRYTIELDDVDDSSYTLTASPVGVQENRDTQCGVLGVDHTGQKSASGEGGAAGCW